MPPIGVKLFAPCKKFPPAQLPPICEERPADAYDVGYETSLTAGDAACSYGGIVYPDLGASFPVPGPGSSNSTGANASSAALTTSAGSNVSLSLTALTALTSLSNSTSILYATSPAPAVAGVTALADLATISSAPYPIPSATNASALAVGTVIAPSKTDGSGAMFTGAAGRTKVHMGAVVANLVANAVAFGLVLLL